MIVWLSTNEESIAVEGMRMFGKVSPDSDQDADHDGSSMS